MELRRQPSIHISETRLELTSELFWAIDLDQLSCDL